jgi:hypothetical protein
MNKLFSRNFPLIVRCWFYICPILLTAPSFAQTPFVRAKGEGPKIEIAKQKAIEKAWSNYIASFPRDMGAKADNLRASKEVFLEKLDEVFTDITVLEEKCEGILPAKCYYSIKATISDTAVESILREVSQLKGSSAARGKSSGPMAFLVMARIVESELRFDDKITKRAESTVGTSGSTASADASLSKSGQSVDASAETVSVTQVSKTVKGGSVEVKRDKLVYEQYSEIQALQTAIGQSLQTARIRITPWGSLVNRCKVPPSDNFSTIFAKDPGGSLPDATKDQIFENLSKCGISKIILSTISLDGFRTDPNNGRPMVTGSVNVEAYDLTTDFPESLGVAKKTVAGRAETKLDAARNALEIAAEEVAQVVINQFSNN